MTREEIYNQCVQEIDKTNCLLMELPTGYGKTRLSLDLINNLAKTKFNNSKISILLLVAKRVHKKTWEEEIEKWGGINNSTIVTECYESLKNHTMQYFDIILMDECHHINSELRKELLSTLSYKYMLGLSATIPKKLKMYFNYKYHSRIVSCNIVEAIETEILPEPQILLFPLILDNRIAKEEWEINAKAKNPVVYGEIKDIWKYKKQKVHAILKCTERQKLLEFNKLIEWEKSQYMRTRREPLKMSWLYHAGRRLEFLANCKNQIVSDILKKLNKERTITFCKTIEQCEILGKNCIHSQNKDADKIYDAFNKKKINHITAVNILNENANLVDCKYGIFANLSSSDLVQVQRTGRLLRHKQPVIIFPYFKDTREEEILDGMLKDYNKEYIRTIHSINEI